MQNPNPLLRFFLLFGAPLLVIVLCMRPVFGDTLTDPEAQFKHALAYQNGQYIKKDLQQAIYWYEQAAKQGYTKAQFNLGTLLCEGYEIPKEPERGLYWLEQAAKQGEANAQYKLGYLYLEGKLLKQDRELAHYWLKAAAASNHKDALMMLSLCPSDDLKK